MSTMYYTQHTVSSAGGAAGPLPRSVPHPRPLHSHRAGLGHRHPRLPQPQQGEGGIPSFIAYFVSKLLLLLLLGSAFSHPI